MVDPPEEDYVLVTRVQDQHNFKTPSIDTIHTRFDIASVCSFLPYYTLTILYTRMALLTHLARQGLLISQLSEPI